MASHARQTSDPRPSLQLQPTLVVSLDQLFKMHSVVLLTAIAASVVGTVAQNSTAHFNTTTSTPTTLSIGTASVTLFNGGEAAVSNIPGYQSRTDLYSADIVNADACGVTYAVAYPGADIGAQTVSSSQFKPLGSVAYF